MITKKKYGCMKTFWDISYFGGIAGTVIFIGLLFYSFFDNMQTTTPPMILGLFIYGLIPGGLGFYFRKKFAKAESDYKNALIQRMLFTIAKGNNGIVKVTNVAMNLEITYEDAKAMLNDISLSGIATAEVDEEGIVYYVFPELRNNN